MANLVERLLDLARKRFPDDWTHADDRLFRHDHVSDPPHLKSVTGAEQRIDKSQLDRVVPKEPQAPEAGESKEVDLIGLVMSSKTARQGVQIILRHNPSPTRGTGWGTLPKLPGRSGVLK